MCTRIICITRIIEWFMKSIINKILLAIAILSILTLAAYPLVRKFLPKESVYNTTPFGLVTSRQQTVRASSLSMSYYLSSDSLSVVYSYETAAGIDFSKDSPIINGDTILLPYPTILPVDQNDDEKPWIVMTRAHVGILELKPYKMAMEKITSDFARSSGLAERSAEYLKDFFQSMDTANIYAFQSKVPNNSTHYELPYSPAYIDYYEDLLSAKYEIIADTTRFNQHELIFSTKGKEVFSLSNLCAANESFDVIRNEFKGQDHYILHLPYDTEKLLYVSADRSYAFMDGRCYCFKQLCENEEDFLYKYLPDMIYLLSCIHPCLQYKSTGNYYKWLEYLNTSIDQINKGLFLKAASTFKEMSKLQDGNLSQNEKALNGLCGALTGHEIAVSFDDEKIEGFFKGYENLFIERQSTKMNSLSNRAALLEYTQGYDIHEWLESYFMRTFHCDENEIQDYTNDMVQTGTVVDKSVLQKLDSKSFFKYIVAIWQNSLRDYYEVDGTKREFDDVFPTSSVEDNVVIMRDHFNLVDDPFGEDYRIIENLQLEGFSITQNPQLILVLQQKHREVGGLDQDALIFSKDSLKYIANFNGLTSQDCVGESYANIKLSRDGEYLLIHPKDKYKIHAPLLVSVIKKFKESFGSTYDEFIDVVRLEYQKSMIDFVNSYISRYTLSTPIDYEAR